MTPDEYRTSTRGAGGERGLRGEIVAVAASLFARGLTAGSSGNLTVRLRDGGFLATPTGSSLGRLDPDRLSRLSPTGEHLDGDRPTKELPLHLALYRHRPEHAAVVHLHSPHATAVSCLAGLDARDCLPPLTAYHVMRVGPLPLVPYHPPGDTALGVAIENVIAAPGRHASGCAVLLANHGPVVAGRTLHLAADAAEELEQTARIFLLLGDRPTRPLSTAEISELTDPNPATDSPTRSTS